MFFLPKIGIGLDVDDLSLELVSAQAATAKAKILASSRVVLPQGLVVNGVIKDEAGLADYIKKLFASAKPSAIKPAHINFGIPHTQFYPALVELSVAEPKKLAEEIWRAACENLPVEEGDLLIDYKILESKSEHQEVLIVGASRKYLLAWQKFLTSLGITIDSFDISAYALWRDLAVDKEGTVALIDIGANKSNLFVFHKNNLQYSYDFEIGGVYLTKLVADKYNLSLEKAEEKKIKSGLDKEVLSALEIGLYDFAKEIASGLIDYQTKTGVKVSELKLVGGGAKLKGLVNYLQEKLPLPVSLAVLASIDNGTDSIFAEANGLALRALSDKYKDEPVIELTEFSAGNSLASVKVLEADDLESQELGSEISASPKLNLQKKILLAVLILGALAVAGAYWYRASAKAKQAARVPAPVVFSQVQSFPYKLTVALSNEAYSEGLIRGRLIDDKISSGNDFNEVLNLSRRKVGAELAPSEELWPDPLNEVIDKTNVTYPMTLRWLALNKQEVLKAALVNVDEINVDKVPYEFNAITKTKIEKTDSLDKVYLYGEVSVSLNDKIVNSKVVDLSALALSSSTEALASSSEVMSSSTQGVTGASSSAASLKQEKSLTITKTETGWLNVRKGPGKSFEIVVKIYPGETYDYLKKEGEWAQITLPSGDSGWILSKYAKFN